MQAVEILKKFKKDFEPHLEAYFAEKIRQAGEIDVIAEEAVTMIRDYTLAGGKRIRPAFLYFGYLAAGGKEKEKIMKVAPSVELLHSFLLIHDDIIDRDATRHGVDTLHEKFKKMARKYKIRKDYEHFGNSMALIAGDMAASMACDIIFNSDFPDEVVMQALDKLQKIVFVTIPGEMIDVIMSYSGEANEEQILKMHEGKTARYTFEGPLQLGCLLAECDDELLGQFSKYALPLGKAFQIRDDILGIFGNEEKLGKPVGSDILEGKQTLLVLKALEFSGREEKKLIKELLGKNSLNKNEIESFRSIIKSTGSLQYSENLARKFAEEAKTALSEIKFKSRKAEIFLRDIADYIVRREI